jgi:hypothetical protein
LGARRGYAQFTFLLILNLLCKDFESETDEDELVEGSETDEDELAEGYEEDIDEDETFGVSSKSFTYY